MAEAKRDRFGRYLLVHPDSGREVSWTRATTLADTLEDQYSLSKWKMRNVVLGVGMRKDLIALAQAAEPEDKKALDDLCEQALAVAGASAKANTGTALHRFTERLDMGERVNAPEDYEPDVEAYRQLLAKEGVEIRPDWVERITVVPELVVAGTIDRIVRYKNVTYIADLKTGQNLTYSWGKIAIQLALYSRGFGLWNETIGKYDDMPPVDRSRALVMHVPAGTATAALYWVDIDAGWEMALVCAGVREWRKRKDLAVRVA